MSLAFLEVKKPNNDQGIQAEFNRMINKRLATPGYQKYFNMIQVVSFSWLERGERLKRDPFRFARALVDEAEVPVKNEIGTAFA